MNKKSNVIVGASVVGVIGLVVLGMGVFGGQGKGSQPIVQSAVVETRTAEPVTSVARAESATTTGSFVASKQGKKYFPVDCGTAKAIKEENKVYFGSEAEAVQAGYERSLTCK